MVSVPIVCRLFGTQVLTHVAPHCVHQGSGPNGLEIEPLEDRLEADELLMWTPHVPDRERFDPGDEDDE